VGDGAVVTEVDDLGAFGLEDAAHDVDGGVVAVEEACSGDEAQSARGGAFDGPRGGRGGGQQAHGNLGVSRSGVDSMRWVLLLVGWVRSGRSRPFAPLAFGLAIRSGSQPY